MERQRCVTVGGTEEDYVSIIGTNYLFPLCTILERLHELQVRGPNEVQASPAENGYAAAAVVLTVFLLESMINRTLYVRGDPTPKHPLCFVGATYLEYVDKLEELFVIRDTIAHNHVWEAKLGQHDTKPMKLVAASRRTGYGRGPRYPKVLDPKSRKTRLLGLNLFPTRVCRDDAVQVLRVALEFLTFLEGQDRRYAYVSNWWVRYDGRMMLFGDMVADLRCTSH